MVGIVSYGAYIPRYRLDKKEISSQMGWFGSRGKGEKSVANHDEDTITIGYTATKNCLNALAKEPDVKGLYLGSLSMPFANRQNSGVIASTLDYKQIRLGDFTGSVRGGTQALLAAIDSAKGGDSCIAVASDCRRPKPGSAQELSWGDGGASLLIGNQDVVAEMVDSVSLASDFVDYRRNSDEAFDHGWEERWIRDEGFMKMVPQAFNMLMEKSGLKSGDINKVVVATTNKGVLRSIPRALGIAPEAVQDNYADTVGDTGTALSYIMLCGALDNAQAGDNIVVLTFGYGVDAILFKATDKLAELKEKVVPISAQVEDKMAFAPYARYLAYKDLIPLEEGIRGESVSPTALSAVHREGTAMSSLTGVKCTACGVPQYPNHRVCVRCGAIDKMEPYSFADKKFKVVSFTSDYLAFSYDPPQIYGIVDSEGGGRILLDFTDCTLKEISVGTAMEPTLRRKYKDKSRSITTYYWKVKPCK